MTYLGSNYAKVRGPHPEHATSRYSVRVHFDNFEDTCTPEPNAAAVIAAEVEKHRVVTLRLMEEVKDLVARLHLTTGPALSAGDDTAALVVGTGLGPVHEYKAALIKAKEVDLPALFKKIEASNKMMASWMKAQLIPLGGEVERLQRSMDQINDRIFNVELYAGLTETVVQISDGKPAAMNEPVHMLQRRHYMDEECLAAYETGGMEFKDIHAFDAWLAKPKNRDRILPFPRCLVAFRVRRNDKERSVSLRTFLYVLELQEADKCTFLYMRNGEKLYRMDTAVAFAESLFPDLDRQLVDHHELWANTAWSRCGKIITDAQYKGLVEAKRAAERAWAKLTKKEREKNWSKDPSSIRSDEDPDNYTRAIPSNVYYDDICKKISDEAAEHNRVVLIVQGLLDRSPVFHPHPPYQLWTSAGFEAAIRLIYDTSRALVAGDRPDFEAYRTRLNASLRVGSATAGQELAWEMREALRENARDRRNWRLRSSDYDRVQRFRPEGDLGPGRIALVKKITRAKTCTYAWKREQRRWSRYAPKEKTIAATLSVSADRLLNADAYTPGDFHLFFDDPRTRADYLKWAPLLLECEEYHAGNREVKPLNKRKDR